MPSTAEARRPTLTALVLTSLLSACGGAGGEVASTPTPPPAPASSPPPAAPTLASTSVAIAPIPSPGTRQGTSDTIALIEHFGDPSTYRLAAPSEVRITTYQPGPTANDVSYTIEFASPELPGTRTSLTGVIKGSSFDVFPNGGFAEYRDETIGQYKIKFGESLTATANYSDGSQRVITTVDSRQSVSEQTSETIGPGTVLWHQLAYGVGLSHVSLGEWMWNTIQPNGNATDAGAVFFVHGDRTQAAEIPTSGTATYSAASLGYDTDTANWNFPGSGAPVRIALTADFGQQSIFAQLNRDSEMFGDGIGGATVILGLDAHGTGQIHSPGDFTIPLAGTVGTTAATGSLDGAFFGPNAEQVGGVFSLGSIPGQPLISDAFVGTRN